MIVNARFLTQRLTGVQRHAIEMSLALKEIHPDIKFVAPKNIIHKDIAEQLKAKVIGRFTGYLWEQYELPMYMKKHASGKILINLANTAPVASKNKVATIHDTAPLRHPEWYSWKFAAAYKLLIPRVAKSSRIIFSDSNFSKSEIADLFGIDHDKIIVIYCGVGQQFQSAISDEQNISPEDYILCVASLEPRKNFIRLVKAFNHLKSHNLKLVIAGSSSSIFADNKLHKMLDDSKRIEFTGYIDDDRLIELYQEARLFVYPSLYEGFGLPPLEAMACGCPCAVSNAGSLPEVCGKAALYFNPYDPADIAEKMDMILSDNVLGQNLIENGLLHAQKFDWNKSASELLEAILSLDKPSD
ncbi:MAG: glycosyltransferase family 1 protein [candidate division Zixibacteria bacterium HGW-Zixibacteria-1]|nr:MAG: glycosyltransferase family 1 protein [candidate division Zixibacteria bacterium HGW-Zixibacteria-1]